MSAHPTLDRRRSAVALYLEQWRVLTVAEGDAIQQDRWTELERLQATKQQLQVFLNGAVEEMRCEARLAGQDPDAVVQEFHGQVIGLVEQESANGRRLTLARQQTQAAQQELESATQQLRQVRHAYVRPADIQWQSYS